MSHHESQSFRRLIIPHTSNHGRRYWLIYWYLKQQVDIAIREGNKFITIQKVSIQEQIWFQQAF